MIGDLGRDRDRAPPGRVDGTGDQGGSDELRRDRRLDQEGVGVIRRPEIFVVMVIAFGDRMSRVDNRVDIECAP